MVVSWRRSVTTALPASAALAAAIRLAKTLERAVGVQRRVITTCVAAAAARKIGGGAGGVFFVLMRSRYACTRIVARTRPTGETVVTSARPV
jgi:hypothetical protein